MFPQFLYGIDLLCINTFLLQQRNFWLGEQKHPFLSAAVLRDQTERKGKENKQVKEEMTKGHSAKYKTFPPLTFRKGRRKKFLSWHYSLLALLPSVTDVSLLPLVWSSCRWKVLAWFWPSWSSQGWYWALPWWLGHHVEGYQCLHASPMTWGAGVCLKGEWV